MSFQTDAEAATVDIVSALGATVTHTPTDGQARTITGVFDRVTAEQAAGIGMEGARTWLEVSTADGNLIAHGDEITVADATYTATGFERDHHGLVQVLLEHSETAA